MYDEFRYLLATLLVTSCDSFSFQLTARAANPFGNANALQDFLSRPIHWPQIVASSNAVRSQTMNVEECIKPGQSVDELFGMSLFNVSWTCRQNQPGQLVVESIRGVPGFAMDCTMTFEIQDEKVEFTLGYTPISPLVYLATPILVVDNWVALNVLLPIATNPAPLDSFRKLMGTLYFGAGLAHAADLWLGQSLLFTSIGLPPIAELPLQGQLYACLWCAVGPLAYVLSQGPSPLQRTSDIGLFLYGLVEIGGAWLSGNQQAWTNAIGVQLVVVTAWFYLQQQQASRQKL